MPNISSQEIKTRNLTQEPNPNPPEKGKINSQNKSPKTLISSAFPSPYSIQTQSPELNHNEESKPSEISPFHTRYAKVNLLTATIGNFVVHDKKWDFLLGAQRKQETKAERSEDSCGRLKKAEAESKGGLDDAKKRKRNQLTTERASEQERERARRRGKGTTKLLIYIVGLLCSAIVGKSPNWRPLLCIADNLFERVCF
jgi:hypothetical protein